MNGKIKWFYLAAILLLVALSYALLNRYFLPPVVETQNPSRGAAVEAVYATGTVEATVMLPIAPRNTARLTELLADEGAEVKKDQPMARLEDNDLKSSLRELEAKQSFAQSDYARQKKLFDRGFASREALDQARSNLDSAMAAVERAKTEAGYMTLLAPADGLIIRRDGEIGQLIPSNQPVFWMSCCAPLRVSAEVDEEDIAKVQPGQKVAISADAFPGQVFHGKVQSITPKGDAVARSYRVRIGFDGEVPLRIGMTAENNIIISENSEALLVPIAAVRNNHVGVVRNGRLQLIDVKTGARDGKSIEIRDGLVEADFVVVPYPDKISDGVMVRVNQR